MRRQLIADHNERPNRIYNNSSLSSSLELTGTMSLDRNYCKVNQFIISSALYFIFFTYKYTWSLENIAIFWGEKNSRLPARGLTGRYYMRTRNPKLILRSVYIRIVRVSIGSRSPSRSSFHFDFRSRREFSGHGVQRPVLPLFFFLFFFFSPREKPLMKTNSLRRATDNAIDREAAITLLPRCPCHALA